ncbi:hypothetical protein BV510_29135 [Mycolicibacterium diernhoferi]|uniref:Uncharacterized protein n=1 Tax=Mycolicibacterium diernhoferi TaxID=1801 RepID=A0A1T3VSS0_9MYCO|nr:hypothetical protein BV510_29135 [Mycolicibacterium diernhoferi]
MDASASLIPAVNKLGTMGLILHGSEELKKTVLPDLVDGRRRASVPRHPAALTRCQELLGHPELLVGAVGTVPGGGCTHSDDSMNLSVPPNWLIRPWTVSPPSTVVFRCSATPRL